MMLSPEERVDNFSKCYPQYSPLVVHNDRLYGFWLIGRWYASDRSFYGSYPPSYLGRIRALFPDCEHILHLFSGTVKGDGVKEITYDIKPELEPAICDDVSNLLKHFQPDEFDLILADPPYEERDFEKYGCKPFSKGKVVKDCSVIVKPDSFLVCQSSLEKGGSTVSSQLYGVIGLVPSTNHRIRAISIFQKEAK